MDPNLSALFTEGVLADVWQERDRQDERWGQQNHPDGTHVRWRQKADLMKSLNTEFAQSGAITWMDILEEEFWEAMGETDPKALRDELIQVAAVAVAWIEAIDRRDV